MMNSFNKLILIFRNKYFLKWLKNLYSIFIIVFIIFEGDKFIKEIKPGKTVYLLQSVKPAYWLLYIALGLAATLIITLYDLTWFYYNKRDVKLRTIIKTSWIASAVNNVVGMGGLTGALIRSVYYKKAGIEDNDIIRINLLIVPSSLTGLSVLMWYNLRSAVRMEAAELYRHPIIFLLIFIFCCYLLLYLLSEFIPFPALKQQLTKWGFVGSLKLKISMVAASAVDWSAAGLFLWLIAGHIDPGLSVSHVFFFYAVAAAAGLLSFIPAGFGSFDLIMIFGLQAAGIGGAEAAGILVLFRLFYYFIPLAGASFLAAADFITKGNTFITKEFPPFWDKFSRKNFINEYQFDLFKDLSIAVVWLLMLIASGIMVISVLTPELPERIHFLQDIFPVPVLQFSNGATLLSGLVLFILSDEIRLKVKGAYYIAMLVLFSGGMFNLIKGFNYEDLVIIIAVIAVLRYSRDEFYRSSIPRNWGRLIKQTVISQFLILLYMLSGQSVRFSFYHLHKGAGLLYQTPGDYLNNSIILSIMIQILILIWFFLQKEQPPWKQQTQSEIFSTLDAFLSRNKGNAFTHLIYLGDKYLYTTADGKALIAFKPYKDKLIALGDPIGNLENLTEYLEEFRRYADLYGYIPVFYQVDQENLTNYHEIGYTFFKLGEEAYVDLRDFDPGDRKYREFRSTRNRLEREGWVFEISEPKHKEEVLKELEKISRSWLGKRREKGFSLGRFDVRYLNRGPVAFLADAGGKPAAFASIMPFYDGETISVDLMRFSKDAPSGSMDYLFMKLFQWGREKGFAAFNLSMAPLSNVGESQYALKEEKAARQIFNYGGAFYNFKGLRKYKEKFLPKWYPKYLAYPKHLRITPLLIDISIMISAAYKN
jgi:phosphatidylglycerol lysyltransferase